MAKMSQTTPYARRPEGERKRERECMRQVLSAVPVPKLVFEAFGGIGMTAALMLEMWPRAFVRSYELDPMCAMEYDAAVSRTKRASCAEADCLTEFSRKRKAFDGASLDFNQCTLHDLYGTLSKGRFQRDLISRVVYARPAFIQYTDSAIGKLHLNFRSYGLSEPSHKLYCEALRQWWLDNHGYRLLASANHHAASYHVLVPVKTSPKAKR